MSMNRRHARILQTIIGAILLSLGVCYLVTEHSAQAKAQYVGEEPVSAPDADTAPTVVFVCTSRDDTSWIERDFSFFLPRSRRIVYVADDTSAPFHPPLNHGNEAMSYLTFLIDHYEALPPVAVFLHCHRTTYHNNVRFDNQTAPQVQRMNYSHVHKHGYVNLLCDENGWPSSSCDVAHGASFPLSRFRESEADFRRLVPSRVKRSFIAQMNYILNNVLPDQKLPAVIGAPRGAQFALAREAARRVPLETLHWLRQWVIDSAGHLDGHFVGQVLENLWHVIFLGAANGVLCPSEDICYCDLYGLCD
ncbi:uncharacterized protein PV07_00939 [Cladophialophora immunda]|uniref:DUF3431 domain-containing protein n=1 Tax=Cladophialophora immunda TaxID=569365 RepID=A0A0D2CSI6_9EURO|nr:uncharacterized protein PV07_00939 [Cladophialophora immunda]KIW34143.1 hypothetical protein PV07_00939 [Cladophialophora immunda]